MKYKCILNDNVKKTLILNKIYEGFDTGYSIEIRINNEVKQFSKKRFIELSEHRLNILKKAE